MLKRGLRIRRANEEIQGYPEGSLWLVYAYGDGSCRAVHIGWLLSRVYLWVSVPLATWTEVKIIGYTLTFIWRALNQLTVI